MTLLDIERLVRRISEVLQEPDNAPVAAKLAEDFAAACHATNLRLQQCEAMLRAGDKHQAIQLAETAPNLLDCVTALEFRNSDQWHAYCQRVGLMVADRIDARSVHALNECYAEGIATNHPLYAAYRKATLSRNDEDALKALQSITRLNPLDSNAASELTRLDGKVLQAKLGHLDDLVSGGSSDLIVAQVQAIEGFGFRNTPAGGSWLKAQVIRCDALLNEAEKLEAQPNWPEILSKIDLIRRLQEEHGLEFEPTLLRRLENLENRARAERDKDQRNREFQARLGELHYLVQQSEEKDTSARQVGLREMREDYEGLNKVWRALEEFTRPIPEDAAAAFRKRAALLEAELVRRTSVRRRGIILGLTCMLAIGGIAAWLGLAYFRAGELARELNEAVAQRRLRAAEKLLESGKAHRGDARTGRLGSAMAAAETLVGKERALLKTYEMSFARLPKELGGAPSAGELTRIASDLNAVRGNLDALSPDLKTEREPEVRAFEQRWAKFLSDSTEAVNASFDRSVGAAETECADLDFRAPLEKARAQLGSLSNLVFQVNACESGFTNHLRLRSDLLQRASAVQAKFTAYVKELLKIDQGSLQLQKARNISEYKAALSVLASSEFSSSPEAKAASALQAAGPDEESVLRSLLNATNPGVWAFIKAKPSSRFVPETIFPGESAVLSGLNADPAVSANLQRVRLWLDAQGTSAREWIVAGAFSDTVGWKTIKACEPSTTTSSCEFSEREYGFFDGQYKLSPTQAIYRIQPVGSVKETSVFHSLGFEKLSLAPGSSRPLIEVLDALKDSHEGSPLFRAYLFLRVAEIMKLQPEPWGLAFAPAIPAHHDVIRAITENRLSSGDWFVAAKVNAWGPKLDQLFASARQISYSKQAVGLLALAREARGAGLRYVGYVGMNGKPAFLDGTPPEEVWCLLNGAKQPVLLRSTERGGMPFSPLFALSVSRTQLLVKAAVDPQAPWFMGVLPPLVKPDQPK